MTDLSKRSGGEQPPSNQVVNPVVLLMREYFILKDQAKRLKESRNTFMETHKCTNMLADGYMEPPMDCVHRSYHEEQLEDDACESCKRRHRFYIERQKNSRRRGVIMRLVRNQVSVSDLASKD